MMHLDELDLLATERTIFRNVFLSSEDGLSVLAWIGNECTGWVQDPSMVRPDLVAFWNRLLGKLGIVKPDNLLELVKGLGAASNDNDVAAERRSHGRERSPGDTGAES